MTSVRGQPCCPALKQPTTQPRRTSLTPPVFAALFEPLPPPSSRVHYLTNAGWRNGVRLLPRRRVQRVRVVGCWGSGDNAGHAPHALHQPASDPIQYRHPHPHTHWDPWCRSMWCHSLRSFLQKKRNLPSFSRAGCQPHRSPTAVPEAISRYVSVHHPSTFKDTVSSVYLL